MSPSPNRFHQEISRNLEFLLLKFLEHHPTGELFDAPFDVYLGDHDVFQPDIVYVANDRRSILTEAGAEGAPTLVIEILSPGTAPHDRTVKKEVYARSGVEELWLVDPQRREIEAYRLQEDADNPHRRAWGSEPFMSACFPGLEFDVSGIFRRRFSS